MESKKKKNELMTMVIKSLRGRAELYTSMVSHALFIYVVDEFSKLIFLWKGFYKIKRI